MVQAIADKALEDHRAAHAFIADASMMRIFEPRHADRGAAARKRFETTSA